MWLPDGKYAIYTQEYINDNKEDITHLFSSLSRGEIGGPISHVPIEEFESKKIDYPVVGLEWVRAIDLFKNKD